MTLNQQACRLLARPSPRALLAAAALTGCLTGCAGGQVDGPRSDAAARPDARADAATGVVARSPR